jgi:hypothetical protein
LAQVLGGFPHPLKLILRLRQGPRVGVHHQLLAGLQFVHPPAQRVGAGLLRAARASAASARVSARSLACRS